MESGSVLNVLRDHKLAVQDLQFNENTLVTASRVSSFGA